MLKIASAVVVAVLGILVQARGQPAPPDLPRHVPSDTIIELGKPFEGDLRGKAVLLETEFKQQRWKVSGVPFWDTVVKFGRGESSRGFLSPVSVRLKAGKGVVISCKVIGDDRKVQLFLRDPDGIVFRCTKFEPNVGQLKIGAVPATGVYEIVVFSDQGGRFTLRATSDGDQDEKALEERLKELEQEIGEVKARLAKLKESKVDKP